MRRFSTIPTVDISGLALPDREARRRAAEALGEAARDVGFLYITGHGVPPSAIEAVRGAAERFFAQAPSTKLQSFIGRSSNHSGYAAEGEETVAGGKPGKKETYDVGLDYDGPDRRPMLGPNLWPTDEGFRDDVTAYYALMSDLARRLFRGFAMALGLEEDHFEDRLHRPPSQLRLVHYPFDADAEDREGVGAHTDYECFTLLASTAPGLEVVNDEGRWIDAPPQPGALVLNIGEMLEVWSNGAFVATTHRVRAVKEERYSFPFFAALDYDTVVAPLPAFIGPRGALYRPVALGDHLFAQTINTFAYLRERVARGEIEIPAFEDGEFGRPPTAA